MNKNLITLLIFTVLLIISCDTTTESDLVPPTVEITSPTNNEEFSLGSEILINANANDNVGIKSVAFYIDEVLVFDDQNAPYEYNWNTGATKDTTNHDIYAKAYDTSDNTSTSSTITVILIETSPNKPSNPMPSDYAKHIKTDINISWNCADPDGDSLVFDVFFGINSDPPLVINNHNSSIYDPGILNEETTYYWKIDAKDDDGNVVEGDVWSFKTYQTGTITDIDGNVYQTIKIGNHWWMAENLKVTHYRNGDPIPIVTEDITWSSDSTGAYCYYDNDTGNIDTYGHLYNWYAAKDSSNHLAPEGWHVPSDDEWQALVDSLGGYSIAGGKIKTTGTIEGGDGLWYTPNTGATNENGFSTLPGGYRLYSGDYFFLNYKAYFWSSTETDDESDAWFHYVLYDFSKIFRNYFHDKKSGFSVRCVMD